MLVFLRGALIVAAIAWWSPTHEPPADPRVGDRPRPLDRDVPSLLEGAAEPVAELRRVVRNAEATRRTLAGSPLAEAMGDRLLSPSRPVRDETPASGR